MNRQKQQFEKLVRSTCRQALNSCREMPNLFQEKNSGMHVTFRMLKDTAPQCGYNNEEFTSLIEPELHRYLN